MKRKIRIGIRGMLVFALFWASAYSCWAALPQTDTIPVYFRTGSSIIEHDFLGNNANLDQLDKRIADQEAARIENLIIVSSSSPEGTMESNSAIMERRAQSLRAHIAAKHPHLLAVTTIRIETIDQTLTRFLLAIEADELMPDREQVLAILKDESKSSFVRLNTVKQMPSIKSYIASRIYPYMRAASVYIGREVPPPPPPTNDTIRIVERIVTVDTLRIETPAADTLTAPKIDTTQLVELPVETLAPVESNFMNKPLFALKTNLLFDAISAINLEVEVPIGKRWSVAAELIFPWWLDKDKQRCFQLINGNVEGRYWFGDRDMMSNGKTRDLMTGWFAGLYVGGGYYDFEWETKGFQGEFFIAAGISGGYVHTINKAGTLRMEYSLGIGFMESKYRQYAPQQGGNVLMWQHDGKFSWFGPTRAKVSLVWMLDTDLFKKRGGRK